MLTSIVRQAINPQEIEGAIRFRRKIFVEEQGIPLELDADGLDEDSLHVIALNHNNQVIGNGRLSPKGFHGVISRIAIDKSTRGQGLGRQIMIALEKIARENGLKHLSLKPHAHLETFYSSLGYTTIPNTRSRVGEHELLEMEKKL